MPESSFVKHPDFKQGDNFGGADWIWIHLPTTAGGYVGGTLMKRRIVAHVLGHQGSVLVSAPKWLNYMMGSVWDDT
jgi:hypothetical protein